MKSPDSSISGSPSALGIDIISHAGHIVQPSSPGPSSPTWLDSPYTHYIDYSFPPPSSSLSSQFDDFVPFEIQSQHGGGENFKNVIGPASLQNLPENVAPPHVAIIAPALTYRAIQPSDLAVLQALHEALFPISYEQEFFSSVVYGRGIVSWAAIDTSASDSLIGFVTARVASVSEGEEVDLLGYELGQNERQTIYILTLGVTKPYRNLGIASKLIGKVVDYALSCPSCRAVYLHVIAYNRAAIFLYKKNRFQCLRRLSQFYFIGGKLYDAYLYVFYVNGGRPPFSATDIVGSASSFLRSIYTVVMERLFWRREQDDKRAKWPRTLELWASLFSQGHPCRITEARGTCPPCV